MGDNDGNISMWKLSDDSPDKPFLLIKNETGELIEDISWSIDGLCLMATTMKRYIIIVVFDDIPGYILSDNDKNKYLNDIYGSIR
jgi:hypothetical protein